MYLHVNLCTQSLSGHWITWNDLLLCYQSFVLEHANYLIDTCVCVLVSGQKFKTWPNNLLLYHPKPFFSDFYKMTTHYLGVIDLYSL